MHGLQEAALNLGLLRPLPTESSAPQTCHLFTKSVRSELIPLASPRISELVRGWAGGARVMLSRRVSLVQA